MDEAEPPSRAEPWASALRTASPRSTYGASPRFTPRSSRVGASSAAGSSTSPRSFGGPNVTTLKLEALLARMEARMEEVDRKVDRTEKATREIARLKVQVESQQMSISRCHSHARTHTHLLGGTGCATALAQAGVVGAVGVCVAGKRRARVTGTVT
jgi:hypothetical protein